MAITRYISRWIDDGVFNPNDIEITRLELELDRLPSNFDGFRILHLSDFHMGTWMNVDRLEGIIDMAVAEAPDMVAMTGDFVSYATENFIGSLEGPFAKLNPGYGVFAVLGNHDWWTDPISLRTVFRKIGIQELRNAHIVLHRDGHALVVAGVDDVYDSHDDLCEALRDVPLDTAVILLAHEPDFADPASATGRIDFQLSGHSHGGQINLPVIGARILPRLGRKYPRGLYQVGNMKLYTSRGLGTTSLRLRVNCPAEIVVYTLRSRGQNRNI